MECAEFGGQLHRDAHRATEKGVESIHPEHLAGEYRAEGAGDRFGDRIQVECLAEFLLHGGDRFRCDTAGDDQVEVAEVCIYVQRETVGRDEVRDVDADGREFGLGDSRFGPHSGQARHTLGRDGEVSAGSNQGFFKAADEIDRSQSLPFAVGHGIPAQIEDGIADDLTGPVEGDVSTAIAFEDLDAALGKEFRRGDHVCCFGIAAERDHGRVFEQEQHVADLLFFSQRDQLLLQAQAGGVVNGPELDDGDQSLVATDIHGFTPIEPGAKSPNKT